jgi:hypothetical protein
MLALWLVVVVVVVVVDAGKLEKPLCLRLQMLLNTDAVDLVPFARSVLAAQNAGLAALQYAPQPWHLQTIEIGISKKSWASMESNIAPRTFSSAAQVAPREANPLH